MNFIIKDTGIYYNIKSALPLDKVLQLWNRTVELHAIPSPARATTALITSENQPAISSSKTINDRIKSILIYFNPLSKDILLTIINSLPSKYKLIFLSLNKTFREVSPFPKGYRLLLSPTELFEPNAEKLAFADKYKLIFKITDRETPNVDRNHIGNNLAEKCQEAPYNDKIEAIEFHHCSAQDEQITFQNIPNLISFSSRTQIQGDQVIQFLHLPSLRTINIDNWYGNILCMSPNIESISLSNIITINFCMIYTPKLKFLNLNNIRSYNSQQPAIVGLNNLPNLEHLSFSGITHTGLLESLEILQAKIESKKK